MAKILNATELKDRNIWFKMLFFPAIRDMIDTQAVIYKDYNELKLAAKEVYDVIVNAKFKDIDHELNILADAKIIFNTPDPVTGEAGIKVPPQTIATYLASLCSEKQIYWEDIRHTSVTLQEIKAFKETLLGKALGDFECYVSNDPALKQQSNQAASNQTTGAPVANRTRAPSNRQPGQGPQIDYTQSGAHSQDASNLIGQPNQKIMLSGVVYDIEADKIGVNVPHAFVTPVFAIPPYVKAKNKAEQVKFSSSNGYTDMACMFSDPVEAKNFADKCQAKFGSKYTNISVHKMKKAADPNGYFKVSTEFGDCYVRAKWFNEQLAEDIEFEENLNKEKEKFSKMTKDEYYAYMKDFCESHRNILD